MPNKGKLLKTLTHLGLSLVKSLPWFVIETHPNFYPQQGPML